MDEFPKDVEVEQEQNIPTSSIILKNKNFIMDNLNRSSVTMVSFVQASQTVRNKIKRGD